MQEINNNKTVNNTTASVTANAPVSNAVSKFQGRPDFNRNGGGFNRSGGNFGGRPGSRPFGRRDDKFERAPKEFEMVLISLRRVTKATGGGKKMRMCAFVVVGDRKGKVALGIGKAVDARMAMQKAEEAAKRKIAKVNLKGATIQHETIAKHSAATIWMKPAAPGTGIIAGGPARKVLELAGVKDILTKQLGSGNPLNNAYATLAALKSF